MFLQQTRISSSVSNFENLPNELIYVLFDYLYYHEILDAFDQLNSRFVCLLETYRNYHLNLVLQKNKYEKRLHSSQIKSLTTFVTYYMRINNDYFDAYLHPIDELHNRLECLSVCKMGGGNLYFLIEILPKFKQLKALSIDYNTDIDDRPFRTAEIRQIVLFQIYTLKCLRWKGTNWLFVYLHKSETTEQQSSIEYFQFEYANLSDIIWLNGHCQQLKSCSVSVSQSDAEITNELLSSKSFHQLIHLKINNVTSINDIRLVFECLTQLTSLKHLEIHGKCEIEHDMINGYNLQNLIQTYCPQLKSLKFYFCSTVQWEQTQPRTLIRTFMNDFWLIEKKWLVTCAYQKSLDIVYIYTIPNCIQRKFLFQKSWEEISTSTTASNVEDLEVYEFDLSNRIHESVMSSHYLTINKFHELYLHIFFDRLNRIYSLSTIKQVEYEVPVRWQLLSWTKNYYQNCSTMKVNYDNLLPISRMDRFFMRSCFQRIKSLEIQCKQNKTLHRKEVEHLCSMFPNVEELRMETAVVILDLFILVRHFEHLTYLWVRHNMRQECVGLESSLAHARKSQFKNQQLSCEPHRRHFVFFIRNDFEGENSNK